MMLTFPIFVVALFALIAIMHRNVARKADAKLRAQFDAQGAGSEVPRRLMRDAGYKV